MNVLLLGGSGFIGTALSAVLHKHKHSVTILSRQTLATRTQPNCVFLPYPHPQLAQLISRHHAVINLCGASILKGAWTNKRRAELIESRVQPTRALNAALSAARKPPKVVINAAAIGIYAERSHGVFTEASPLKAESFLNNLCTAWEAAFWEPAQLPQSQPRTRQTRKICLRLPIVLGSNGGILKTLLPLYRRGLGTVAGSGTQGFSWIHINDCVRLMLFLLSHSQLTGTINACAPAPVSAEVFAHALAKAVNRPLRLPHTPRYLLRLLMGERSELLTAGGFIISKRLQSTAPTFKFIYPKIDLALKTLVQA